MIVTSERRTNQLVNLIGVLQNRNKMTMKRVERLADGSKPKSIFHQALTIEGETDDLMKSDRIIEKATRLLGME